MYKTYVIFIIQYCAKIVSYVIPSVILTWTPGGKKVGNWDEIDCLWQLLHCCLGCLVHEQHAHQWSRQILSNAVLLLEHCCGLGRRNTVSTDWSRQAGSEGRLSAPTAELITLIFWIMGLFFLYSELIFLFLESFFRLLEKCALRIQENSLAFAKPVSSSLEKYAIRQSILFS